MNNEELYNDGVNILKSVYRKYLAKKQISEEDVEKYVITIHDSYMINKDEKKITMKFMSLLLNQNDDLAYPVDIVYVSLDDISIDKIVEVSTELSSAIKPFRLEIMEYDNYKEEAIISKTNSNLKNVLLIDIPKYIVSSNEIYIVISSRENSYQIKIK